MRTGTRRSLALLSLLTLFAVPILATTFIVPEDAQFVDRARAIVLGSMISSSSGWDTEGPGIVTRYEIEVDEVIKGELEAGTRITITEPGGIAGTLGFAVFGAPEYHTGERSLLFLGRDPQGRWRTFGMELGKFDFRRDPAGRSTLVRGGEDGALPAIAADWSDWVEPSRDEKGFLEFVRARAAGEHPSVSYILDPPASAKGGIVVTPNADPSAYVIKSSGTPVRWIKFDNGGSETIFSNGTQTGSSSSSSALTAGINAWKNDPNSTVVLSKDVCSNAAPSSCPGGAPGPYCKNPTTARANFDCVSQIIFDVAEADMPVDSDAGAIGWGGFWFETITHMHPVSGETFFRAIEAEAFIKVGSLTQTKLDQLVTHEIGHGLAFRHSNSGTPSSSSAVMNSSIGSSFGSTLQKWDKDAVQTVYGPGACSPEITTQPQSKSIASGQSTNLSVAATGTSLSYQWYQGSSGDTSSPIGGATSSSFTTPALTATTRYWVRVSTPSCGFEDSNTATVTVITCDSISITTEPSDQTIFASLTATLGVRVNGTSPQYQWYQGNAGDTSNPMSGATSRDFTTPVLTTTTKFWARVTNSCPSSVNTRTATVTVNPCDTPGITTQPADVNIATGQSTTLSIVATGTAPLTIQWYQGSVADTSTPVGTNSLNYTTPTLTASQNYWARITNPCGSINTRTVLVSVSTCQPASVSIQPSDTTINPGQTATLSVVAGGTGPFTYQWYQGTAPDTSTPVGNNASTFTTPALTANRSYWARITNSCGSADTRTALVTVQCIAPGTPTAFGPTTAKPNKNYTIAWSSIAGASSYQIDESTSPSFASVTSSVVNGFTRLFQHPASGSLTPFYYRVRALADCNQAFVSGNSGTVTVFIETEPQPQPASPSGLDQTAPEGSTEPLTFQFTVNDPGLGKIGSASTGFTTGSSQPWLTATPPAGTIPTGGSTVVTVVAVPTNLPPGSSTGTVTVTSTATGLPIATVPITVTTVAPVAPIPKTGPPANALIIPAIAHVNLGDKQFVSDLRIVNTSSQSITYQLTYTPERVNGTTTGRQTSIEIKAGQTIALNDLAKQSFGVGLNDVGGAGTLEIRPLNFNGKVGEAALTSLATIATSRTYAITANGTFGQFVPGVPFSEFAGKGAKLSLQQIAQSAAYRTNLGLVEGSGQPANVQIRIFNGAGTKVDDFALDPPLQPAEFRQINQILLTRGLTLDDGRIEIEVTSDTGKITAYASVLDNVTDDPFLVTPVRPGGFSSTKFVTSGVADIKVPGSANWRTDMRIFNPTGSPVETTLLYYADVTPQSPLSRTITLQPGEVRTLNNLLESTFSATNTKGALHVTTASPQPLVVTARTYDQKTSGTYGQFVPAATIEDTVGLGDRSLQLLQLEQSVRYRTNVGITELTGNPVTVEIASWAPGAAAAAIITQRVEANQAIQLNRILASVISGDAYNIRMSIRVVEGSGRVTAYASVVDQNLTSQDPTYVPAR